MTDSRVADREWLKSLPADELLDLLYLHIRNIWTVDGLYFLGIESRSGTEPAVEVDKEVWDAMGAIEAKRLIKIFNPPESRPMDSFVKIMQATGWSLDLEDKSIEYFSDEQRLVYTNRSCRVQKNRMKKGLAEFACKPVRLKYFEAFTRTYNPDLKVSCITSPPDEHPDDMWCKWEFKMD